MNVRIAIPQPHSTNETFVAKSLPQYCRAIERAGGAPVEIPLKLSNEETVRLVTTCDAVLLPGSPADVNPEKYHSPRDPHTAPDDIARDNADELLLQDAYNMRKPVLGVCFGLQSLNVWRSGSLVQHLSGPVRHADDSLPPAEHQVAIAADSRLAIVAKHAFPSGLKIDYAARFELTVNSSHHQAAATVGDGLRPVAWCPQDQVIEAVEGVLPEHWVVAVQWHPERMVDDPVAQMLFHAFIEAARIHRSHPRTATLDFESIGH